MSSTNWSEQTAPFMINRQAFGATQNHPTRKSLAQAQCIQMQLEQTDAETYTGKIKFWTKAPLNGAPQGDCIWRVTTQETTYETLQGTLVPHFKANGELLTAEGKPIYAPDQKPDKVESTTCYVFVLSQTSDSKPYLYVGVNHPDPQQTGVIGAEEDPGDGGR